MAAPLVLNTVGALSTNASLFFSATIWMTALLGVVTSAFLIDRIGRRKLCYLSVIPFGIVALLMSIYAQRSSTFLVIGFYALSYATWLGIAVLVWVWSSELFPTHLRGRSQGVCNAWCRIAISLERLPRAGRDGGPWVQHLHRDPVDPDVPDRRHRLALPRIRGQQQESRDAGRAGVKSASPSSAGNGAVAGAPMCGRARRAHAGGSRRAAAALAALVVILLAEGVGWAAWPPGMSALAFWTCAACHA